MMDTSLVSGRNARCSSAGSHNSVGAHRQFRHRDPAARQIMASLQNRGISITLVMMWMSETPHASATPVSARFSHFSALGGEYDFARFAVEQRGHFSARPLHRFARLPSVLVKARRIAENPMMAWLHRLGDPRVNGRVAANQNRFYRPCLLSPVEHLVLHRPDDAEMRLPADFLLADANRAGADRRVAAQQHVVNPYPATNAPYPPADQSRFRAGR